MHNLSISAKKDLDDLDHDLSEVCSTDGAMILYMTTKAWPARLPIISHLPGTV